MFRKIGEAPKPPKPPCTHPEHELPSTIVLEPGVYEHVCPGCGARRVVVVNYPTL